MSLPDESLIEIYNFLDTETLKRLMETCKRNYNIVNSFVPPTYYVDEKIIKENFKSLCKSDRNFKNSSLKISEKSFDKLSEILVIVGKSVRSLEIELFTRELQILDKILKFCPSREKLKITFMRQFQKQNYFTSPQNDMRNLTELTLYEPYNFFPYPVEANVDLNSFANSKLDKLTLESVEIKKFGNRYRNFEF